MHSSGGSLGPERSGPNSRRRSTELATGQAKLLAQIQALVCDEDRAPISLIDFWKSYGHLGPREQCGGSSCGQKREV